MIVSRGGLPPSRASSSSRSRSRGSNAILLPPSNAEPAWYEGEVNESDRDTEPPLEAEGPLMPSASSSPVEAEAGTRRRERPAELIAWTEDSRRRGRRRGGGEGVNRLRTRARWRRAACTGAHDRSRAQGAITLASLLAVPHGELGLRHDSGLVYLHVWARRVSL